MSANKSHRRRQRSACGGMQCLLRLAGRLASLLRGIECWRNKTCQPTRSPDRAYEASPSALDTHTPSVNTRRISLDRHVGIDSAHARPLGSILQNHVFCQQVRFTGGILRSPSIFIIAASLYEVAFRGLYRLLPIPLNPRYPLFP